MHIRYSVTSGSRLIYHRFSLHDNDHTASPKAETGGMTPTEHWSQHHVASQELHEETKNTETYSTTIKSTLKYLENLCVNLCVCNGIGAVFLFFGKVVW